MSKWCARTASLLPEKFAANEKKKKKNKREKYSSTLTQFCRDSNDLKVVKSKGTFNQERRKDSNVRKTSPADYVFQVFEYLNKRHSRLTNEDNFEILNFYLGEDFFFFVF